MGVEPEAATRNLMRRSHSRATNNATRPPLLRWLAVFVAGLLAMLLGCTPAPPEPTLLIYGDSLTVLSEPAVTQLYGAQYHLVFRAAGGTGTCDWISQAAADRVIYHPQRVVLAFTGNVDGCVRPDYDRAKLTGVVSNYERGLRSFAATFAGIPVKVIAPPAMARARCISARTPSRSVRLPIPSPIWRMATGSC